MSGPNENVMARVRKMLALANDNGATEGERETALRMVYNILAKHNLSMEQIEASGQVTEEERKRESFDSRSSVWVRHVYTAAADLFFCQYYYDRNTEKQVMVGRVSNLATASAMAAWLVNSIAKEATRVSNGSGIRFTNSFSIGAATKIRSRVEAIRKAQDVAEPGQAVVLASIYTREKAANLALMPRTKSSATHAVIDGEAYAHGKAYGASIGLHRQVGGSIKRNAITGSKS